MFTADYGKPFLDFFTLVPLDPLSFDEAKDRLRKLATRDSAAGLLERLDGDEGRFYGLFTLSGGNPRTLTQLYTVRSRPDAKDRDIEGDPEQLLDQVTPLYKAKFEQLPTQSQQVLDAVGWVEKVELPDTSRSGSQVAERFFDVWYLVIASTWHPLLLL